MQIHKVSCEFHYKTSSILLKCQCYGKYLSNKCAEQVPLNLHTDYKHSHFIP